MIAFVKGKLSKKTPESVIIETNGIGYGIFISLNTFYKLPAHGEEISLHTYTHVREDCLQLFGFSNENEKRLFHLLRGVAKIGPRLALNILSGITPIELREAILSGDQFRISQVPRVGKKTAERIILELKDRVMDIPVPLAERVPVDDRFRKEVDDALEALLVLGYSKKVAENALSKILAGSSENLSVEILIRNSLSFISKT